MRNWIALMWCCGVIWSLNSLPGLAFEGLTSIHYKLDKSGDKPGIYKNKDSTGWIKVSELPLKWHEEKNWILSYKEDGVYLYLDGTEYTKPIAPPWPDETRFNELKTKIAFVYDAFNPSAKDSLYGDLLVNDLGMDSKRVFNKPIDYYPTEKGTWLLYNQGEELRLSFFRQDQNENLCLKTALSHYKEKKLKFYLDEYSALYQDLGKTKTYNTDCSEGLSERVMADLSGEDERVLLNYGEDWTQVAAEGRMPEIYGQDVDNRVNLMIHTFKRKDKRSVILVGAPGVGKTASAMHLANRIARGQVPEWMRDWRVFSIKLGLLNSEGLAGMAEKKAEEIVSAARGKKVILLFDEIHQLVGKGAAEGNPHDVTEVFKTDLANGNLVIVGTTTPEGNELSSLKEKAAFFDRFKVMMVGEPERSALDKIFRNVSNKLEKDYRVKISDELIQKMIDLTNQYLPESFHPRKGKNLLDDLASRFQSERPSPSKEIPISALCDIVSEYANVPVVCRGESPVGMAAWKDKAIHFMDEINKKVIGQEEGKKALERALLTQMFIGGKSERPAGVFLFLGPSGVGKSYLARTFSEYVFGAKSSTEFPMSQYSSSHMAYALIGAPPGYKNSDEPGALYAWVQKKPASTIIFDEIDKAHELVLDAMIPLLERGYIRDPVPTRPPLRFTNGYVIMTSNFGLPLIREHDKRLERLEKGLLKQSKCEDVSVYEENLDRYMRDEDCILPEYDLKQLLFTSLERAGSIGTYFTGRIGFDNIVIFHHLKVDEVKEIGALELNSLKMEFLEKGISFSYHPGVLDYLVSNFYTREHGARNIRNKIESFIKPQIPEKMKEALLSGKPEPSRYFLRVASNGLDLVSDRDPEWNSVCKSQKLKCD